MTMPNMEDFEKELAEANKAIEEYVASLPPAEQAAFNQQVEEMSQMFENMSEDEFEKFLGEMFADEPMMMEPNPFDIAQPIAQEEVVEVVLSAEDKKKVETALAILDDIITQSNLFMVIVNSSADLPNRINLWAKKGDITNWQNGSDWEVFKKELEIFIQKLYRAEEQDLTTKKYKYLLELIADEALYNNLIQLQKELKTLVPAINIPEFNIQKLSAQSKKAIKNILAKYTESFYLLTIPKALDTLFEKYAPEEEKIRAAEESATQRALEASRMTRTPAAHTEAGTEYEAGYGDYYGGYGYPDYGYSDYGYGSPYDHGYTPDYGSYGSDYGTGAGRGGSGGGKSGGGATGGGAGKTEGEKDSEETKETKDKKGKSRAEQFIPNYEVERAIADIKSNLEAIKAAFSDKEDNPTKLADLAKYIKEDDSVDVILAGATLPTTVDKGISTIIKSLKKINDKKLNADDLAHYQKEINKFFDANKKELEGLRDSINTFEAPTKEEKEAAAAYAKKRPGAEQSKKTDIATLSKEKQWAYFGGGDDLLDEDNKLRKDITSKVSLFDIRNNIKKLFEDVKSFTTKKAPVAKKEPAITPKKPAQE
ncbi:MAG TPA: hypothetical protein VJJ26_01820 [Candidatus Babeliales bacterium]|nr:hypothetical protein [Candidatus Babeliales bacterium]